MKNKKTNLFYFQFLAILLLFFFSACCVAQEIKKEKEVNKEKSDKNYEEKSDLESRVADFFVPDWFLDPPYVPDFNTSVATATAVDAQTAIDVAAKIAREDISQEARAQVADLEINLKKKLSGRVGILTQVVNLAKIKVDKTLHSAEIINSTSEREKGKYRAYVLVQAPEISAKNIKTELSTKGNKAIKKELQNPLLKYLESP